MANPFVNPSEAPSGGDGWKFSVEENIGSLFVLEPKEEIEIDTDWGKKKVIVTDVTEIDLDDPEDSETHEEVYIFPAWVQGTIRSSIPDGMVLGTLGQDADKGQGRNAAWVLEDPDEEEVEAATEWLNSRSKSKLGADTKKKKKSKN